MDEGSRIAVNSLSTFDGRFDEELSAITQVEEAGLEIFADLRGHASGIERKGC